VLDTCTQDHAHLARVAVLGRARAAACAAAASMTTPALHAEALSLDAPLKPFSPHASLAMPRPSCRATQRARRDELSPAYDYLTPDVAEDSRRQDLPSLLQEVCADSA